ncbi:MAG: type II secretion system ATPase GspE [Candidatus Omnitrophica bacterium]|nr:type II secretion system ATPase GspE [Candidatus Omnitrophota bacterium]
MAQEQKEMLGELLVKTGVLTKDQLNKGLEEHKKTGERLGNVLIRLGLLEEKDLLKTLESQLGIPYVSLSNIKIEPSVISKIPANFIYTHNLIPVKEDNGVLTVAVSDPLDIHTLDDIRLLLGYEAKAVISSKREIDSAIKKYYGVGAATMEKIVAESEEEHLAGEEVITAREKFDIGDMSSDASIIKFVNQIILEAFQSRATDIHIEPFEDELRVRYRIDGMLHEATTPPTIIRFHSAIVSRIKIMADLNIAEKRLPQDGRIKVKVTSQDIDLRVSVIPTIFGESVNIRILSKSGTLLELEQIGLPHDDLKKLNSLIKKPHGIILLTGPTGCGKTTTLYACLSKINSIERKIITIEDPIEYQLRGISQMQVKPQIALTFASGLRSILRQDPDVIMVGEIRDAETAEISIRSALTGHLVFSTLHTNDAAGGITRLTDMGIEPFLIASSIEGIIAQRLVRILCARCKEPYKPETDYLKQIGFHIPDEKGFKIYREKGCEECRHTGYKGRFAIFEILVITEPIKKLILEKASAGVIKREAQKLDMKTLRDAGWDKVKDGLTTIEEVLRVSEEEDAGIYI